MRLLFVSNFYPPHDRGGYEKHCHEVAVGLQARGHEVSILTSQHGVAQPINEGKVYRMLNLEADLEHYQPLHFFFRLARNEEHNAQAISNVLDKTQPDLVVFWGMWNLSRNLPAIVEHTDTPLCYWVADWWPLTEDMHARYWQSPADHRYLRPIQSLIGKLALKRLQRIGYPPRLRFEHVACGSRFLQQELAQTIPQFRLARVILCGTELNQFADHAPRNAFHDADLIRLLYLGTLAPHKGVHTILDALHVLRRDALAIGFQLTVVGAGHKDYEALLRDKLRELAIEDLVTFAGAVPGNAVPGILREHDILIVPSIWDEPFGRVLVEGMAAGLVVVGTATGGSAEILEHDVNGLVFQREDHAELARCLQQLACDRGLYSRLSHSGKLSSANFDLRKMIDGLEQFFVDTVTEVGRAA